VRFDVPRTSRTLARWQYTIVKKNSRVSAPLLNDHEIAEMLSVSVGTVRRFRLFQQGPRYLKIGASVRYRPEDVAAWLDSRPSGGGKQEEEGR
jgi:predicted DNA-binding transcriptional regulator AlpA